jgi:hypothetical protein
VSGCEAARVSIRGQKICPIKMNQQLKCAQMLRDVTTQHRAQQRPNERSKIRLFIILEMILKINLGVVRVINIAATIPKTIPRARLGPLCVWCWKKSKRKSKRKVTMVERS